MKSLKSLKPIIFDLDDTLIPSSSFYSKAVEYTLGADPGWSEAYRLARAAVKEALPVSHVSSRNRLLYFKAYLDILGDQSRSAITLYDTYEAELSRLITEWMIRHKRFAFLKSLSESYSLYVITNENLRTQLAKIEAIYAAGDKTTLFKGILTSEEAGFEKPSLRIFELFFKRYGLKPENCVFVGDSYDNDIVPGLELGMTVVQTLEFIKLELHQSSHKKINHIEQLVDLL